MSSVCTDVRSAIRGLREAWRDVGAHFSASEEISDGKTRCLWYNGRVGEVEYNGIGVAIYCRGNIDAVYYENNVVKEVVQKGKSFYDKLHRYIRDDAELDAIMHGNNQPKALALNAGNWIEYHFFANGKEMYDADCIDGKIDDVLEAFNPDKILALIDRFKKKF